MKITLNIICIVIMSLMISSPILSIEVLRYKDIARNYTTHEFAGQWYYIANIYKQRRIIEYKCEKQFVTEQNYNRLSITWSGRINDSYTQHIEMTGGIEKPGLLEILEDDIPAAYYTLWIYNDGRELVACYVPTYKICSILSRYRTASAELLQRYEELAKHNNMDVSYVDQNNCKSIDNNN